MKSCESLYGERRTNRFDPKASTTFGGSDLSDEWSGKEWGPGGWKRGYDGGSRD